MRPLVNGSRISAAAVTTVAGRPADVCLAVLSLDPARTFTGYGPLPAVTTTTHHGSWRAAGDSRTVTFSDGSSAREVITTHLNPHVYAYRLTELTGVLGRLAQHADSTWHFTTAGAGTRCEWSFTFTAKPRRAALMRFVLLPLWTAYMRKALRNTAAAVDDLLTT